MNTELWVLFITIPLSFCVLFLTYRVGRMIGYRRGAAHILKEWRKFEEEKWSDD